MVFCEAAFPKINGTELIIGEIQDVWVPDALCQSRRICGSWRAVKRKIGTVITRRRPSRLLCQARLNEPTVIS